MAKQDSLATGPRPLPRARPGSPAESNGSTPCSTRGGPRGMNDDTKAQDHALALAVGAAVFLGVGGFFAVSTQGGPQTAQNPGSTPKVTTPAPPTATPTPTPPATPAPTPHQPVPQPVGSTQPVAQGLTMTVLGSQITRIPSPRDGLSEVVGIHVILHNPSATAVTPDYQTFKLYAADGTAQGQPGKRPVGTGPGRGRPGHQHLLPHPRRAGALQPGLHQRLPVEPERDRLI